MSMFFQDEFINRDDDGNDEASQTCPRRGAMLHIPPTRQRSNVKPAAAHFAAIDKEKGASGENTYASGRINTGNVDQWYPSKSIGDGC